VTEVGENRPIDFSPDDAAGPTDGRVRIESRLWALARKYRYEIVNTISASLFGWYVLWQGTLAPPVYWPDSQAYESLAAHPLWSSAFWEGQKPPLTSLLWKFTGSPEGFVLVQSLIFVFCWVYLARTVAAQLGKARFGVAGTWLVLGFASTAPVLLWNRSVLSDSLAVSAVALLFAVIIRLLEGFTWLRFGALMGVAAMNVLNRYSQITTVAFLVLVTVVIIVLQLRRGVRSRWLLSAAAGLVAIAGLSMYLESKSALTPIEITSIYQTRVFPFPDRVAWFSSHGLPDSQKIDAAAAAITSSSTSGKVVTVNQPAVTTWLDARGTSTYALWLLTHPVLIFTEPFNRPEQAYYSDGGVLQIYGASNRTDSPLTKILYGTWLWLIPVFVVSLAVAGLRAFWRRRECRMMLILAVAGLFTMLLAWQTDGQETDRHMLEGAVEFRLAILLCSLYALNTVSMSWSTTGVTGDQPRYSIRIRRQGGVAAKAMAPGLDEERVPASDERDSSDVTE
jgi:hypothetical protein